MRMLPAVCLLFTIVAAAADSGNLRVGAAKVDITPKAGAGLRNVWGTEFTGIHDPIAVRAIVLDNGLTSAALIGIDTSSTQDTLAVRQRIQKETGVPAERIFISSTHTHNAPAVGAPTGSRERGEQAEGFTTAVENAFVESVRQSKARLQPAKMGLAAGYSGININRDEFAGDRWKAGRNPNGPSDKTVWVLKFSNAAGEPIAFFVNYAAHPLVLGPDNTLITGDMPGAMSRFVESYYQEKAVAVFTQGPSGDQNLIASSWDLDDKLTHKVREPGELGFQLNEALGRILAEEVIRAGESIRDTASTASIWSASKEIPCEAGKPLHMDLLMVNQVALAGIAAEIYTNINTHLKQVSPLANSIMVTNTNGRQGYIGEDAAYGIGYFPLRTPKPSKACGEGVIVNFFADGMKQRLASLDAGK